MIPKKKSPFKDVTDRDYSIASFADSLITKSEREKYFTPTYKKVGRKMGDLAKSLGKRVTSNVKELSRLAKQNLKLK